MTIKKKRIWVFSDTHGKHDELLVPTNIDIAICAGDISNTKDTSFNCAEVASFLHWYDKLPIKHKLYIPGNHDTSVEHGMIQFQHYESVAVLIHDFANIDGLTFFGSPYTPAFCNWAYNLLGDQLKDAWKCIPKGTDIVITHGPPQGFLDNYNHNGVPREIGDEYLAKEIKEVAPKYHLFGHNHCDASTIMSDGKTIYINASVCNNQYVKVSNGVVFSI